MDTEKLYNLTITYDEFSQMEYGLRLRIKEHQRMLDLNVSNFCNEYATKRIQICKQAIVKLQIAVFGRSFEK